MIVSSPEQHKRNIRREESVGEKRGRLRRTGKERIQQSEEREGI